MEQRLPFWCHKTIVMKDVSYICTVNESLWKANCSYRHSLKTNFSNPGLLYINGKPALGMFKDVISFQKVILYEIAISHV